MAKRSPDRVDEHRLTGIAVRFEYWNRRRDVVTVPDESDLKAATCYQVLYLWTQVGNWAVRFVAANPTWTVNGSNPVEKLDDE